MFDTTEIVAAFGEEFDAAKVPTGMLRAVKFSPMMHVDKRTPDGRLIVKDGFSAQHFPHTFAFQFKNVPAHMESVPVGRVDRLEIDKSGKVTGYGWIADTPDGNMAAFMIDTKVQKGMSVDLSVSKVKFNYNDKTDSFEIDLLQSSFRGVTGVARPAFPDAKAMLASFAEHYGTDDLAAAAVMLPEMLEFAADEFEVREVSDLQASAVLADLPTEMFSNPELERATPVHVTPEGRVMGHIATWDTCHVGVDGRCVTPPRSRSNYAHFATHPRRRADGETVWTGPLVLGNAHARPELSSAETAEFYANTCRAWCDVVIGEDAFGIWVSGAPRPGVTEADLHAGAHSAVSGHWKRQKGALELLAVLSVNAPGFQVPRPVGFADEAGTFDLAAAGALAPISASAAAFSPELHANIEALADFVRGEMVKRTAEEADALLASFEAFEA